MVAFIWMLCWMKFTIHTLHQGVHPHQGTGWDRNGERTTISTQGTHPVFLTPLYQVMRQVALAVEAAVQMTSVPLSLISSWLKHRLLTQTGGRWRLRPYDPASHCRHCSSPSSASYCRDNGDNLETDRKNCVLATETVNFLLFLHSWTMDHATNTCSFVCEESSTATCFPFCFPKEHQVPDWTASCFLQISLKRISTLERILSQIFITGDFLSFISFYAAEVKRSYRECFFFPNEKKKGGVGGRNQWSSFLSELGLTLAAPCKSEKSTEQKTRMKKMQPFFTDSQISFRDFCRIIQVIRMIIAIKRQSGFFSNTRVCLNDECLAIHLPTTSDWYEGREAEKQVLLLVW